MVQLWWAVLAGRNAGRRLRVRRRIRPNVLVLLRCAQAGYAPRPQSGRERPGLEPRRRSILVFVVAGRHSDCVQRAGQRATGKMAGRTMGDPDRERQDEGETDARYADAAGPHFRRLGARRKVLLDSSQQKGPPGEGPVVVATVSGEPRRDRSQGPDQRRGLRFERRVLTRWHPAPLRPRRASARNSGRKEEEKRGRLARCEAGLCTCDP